ncbi:type II toxin-antitoxin system RelE/ParE family toxin [Massilia atriviolacea]|uniref:Type II toxin-antitoxin system RelE/ParE family toxin n=1 Tax=Massilia atriviolacea TaxID=2495579 RepID=A0A430HE52_9BURK|nr:type II toxin-antitoxin system RelE/ParE family toxin [Massilia atriviolacea]RSZ55782.1 type II toxin-antitoxin system RelE/ParE family toxin [Massilia atriviolacea]
MEQAVSSLPSACDDGRSNEEVEARFAARRSFRRQTELAAFPRLGHAGKIRGTLELIVHESYRIVYEINGETIGILALVNSSRQWPPAS